MFSFWPYNFLQQASFLMPLLSQSLKLLKFSFNAQKLLSLIKKFRAEKLEIVKAENFHFIYQKLE
jgi:hypothetical protein